MKRTRRRPTLAVTIGAKGVVAHAGARLLCDLADDLGLTEELSVAMAPTKSRKRGHDRGEVLVDLAVAVADGARAISDLRVLSDQPSLFGEVASVLTARRTLEAVDGEVLERIATARAAARRRAWEAGMDPGFYVIDIDGSLVTVNRPGSDGDSVSLIQIGATTARSRGPLLPPVRFGGRCEPHSGWSLRQCSSNSTGGT